MLHFTINSIIEKPSPDKKDFEILVSEIELEHFFEGEPRRFLVSTVEVGRFVVDRTKSIVKGDTVYSVYKWKGPNLEDNIGNTKIGYEIHIRKGEISSVFKKNNPEILNGVELLTNQKKYL
jgi:hypothetical protein